MIGAERVDIKSTTPCVTRIDRKFLRLALALDIAEDSFDTMLMKLTFLPESDQVAE